jgi:hypothetical protein
MCHGQSLAERSSVDVDCAEVELTFPNEVGGLLAT